MAILDGLRTALGRPTKVEAQANAAWTEAYRIAGVGWDDPNLQPLLMMARNGHPARPIVIHKPSGCAWIVSQRSEVPANLRARHEAACEEALEVGLLHLREPPERIGHEE